MAAETRVENAIRKATEDYRNSEVYKQHKHGRRCMNIIKGVMARNEETIMEVRQSHFRSIAPDRFIITNKRIMPVRPSLFGLYTGKNLFSPTDIAFIPYQHVISVIISRGIFFSTIHMRIIGSTESKSAIREGELEGLWHNDALRFANFIEDVIGAEGPDHEKEAESEKVEIAQQQHWTKPMDNEPLDEVRMVNLDEARRIVEDRGLKVIWLGVENVHRIGMLLDVSESRVEKLEMTHMPSMDAESLQALKDSVLVCYDDSVASHMARFLKKEYGVDTYVLEGGIKEVAVAYQKEFSG